MEVKDLLNLERNDITLVAVSKTKPVEEIKKKYNEGFINFGENRANELVIKQLFFYQIFYFHFQFCLLI